MYLTWRAPAAMALCGLAVLVVPSMWLVWGWALALLAVIALDIALAPSTSTLRFQREPLDSVHLGEQATSVLTMTNVGSRVFRGAVRDSWLPSAGAAANRDADTTRVRLAPRETGRLEIRLTPTRRGFRRTDQVAVRSRGPLGLAGRQRGVTVPGVIQVLPAFASRRHLPSRVIQLREIEGQSQVRAFGRGSEFDSLREYVRGDDVRSIDWRASARSREPIVRTWRPERDRRVVIVLDTSRLSAARLGDTTRLDAAMDACLLLAALAAHAGDSVVWMAGDLRVAAEVAKDRTAPGETVRRILTAMVPLESHLVEADWRSLTRRIEDVSRRGALVVLVTPFSPASVEESLLPHLPALAADRRVVIASVADPEVNAMRERRSDLREVYDAAAAERVTARTDHLRDVVEATGVGVLHLDADQLPAALADRYLQLKRDGLL